jgi:hypothetical protein
MSASTIKTDTPPPPPPVPPKRGGIHPQFGRFIGGSKLNDAYETVGGSGTGLFRFSTQRRHEKTLASIEKTLRDARDSTTGIKFNGTLEPGKDNPSEIGKERFISFLKKRVTEHGQQTFYHIMDTDGKVVDLFENAQRFKLDYVVAEHEGLRSQLVSWRERHRSCQRSSTIVEDHGGSLRCSSEHRFDFVDETDEEYIQRNLQSEDLCFA